MKGIYRYLDLLLYLGRKEKVFRQVRTSTIEISKMIFYSQQNVSRKLLEMEKLGLIHKEASHKGTSIKLTKKAVEELKKLKQDINSVIDIGISEISGKVVDGLGEGKYYMNLEGYQSQFRKKMGMRAYPGTLNLVIDPTRMKQFIHEIDSVKITGFKTDKRSYGELFCYPVQIESRSSGIDGFVVVPDRTTHPEDIMELIAGSNLRKKMGLKVGSKVKVKR